MLPEFQNRTSTAVRRLRAGLDDTAAFPLYPDGMADPHLAIEGSVRQLSFNVPINIRTYDMMTTRWNEYTYFYQCRHGNFDTALIPWDKEDAILPAHG
jgi:hypothetical protein